MAQGFIDNCFLLREADLLMEHCLRLEAVLLLLLPVIAHLTLNRLALLVVNIILGLLWSHTSLKLASLHWLAVAVLLLHGMWKLVGELLAVLAHTWLAHLFPDLARSVIALLGWPLVAVDG